MFIATDFNPWYKEIDERFWRNFCTDKAKIMTKSRNCLHSAIKRWHALKSSDRRGRISDRSTCKYTTGN